MKRAAFRMPRLSTQCIQLSVDRQRAACGLAFAAHAKPQAVTTY